MRVPTPNVSIVDLTAELEKDATAQQINDALRSAAQGSMKGVLAFEEEPLVSVDFMGNPHSAIVDGLSTNVVAGLSKVVAWYDNEWGYSTRCIDLARFMGERL
jgi:glyceraldehyde 3-phosphate dehydrogenase